MSNQSTRARKLSREVDVSQFLDTDGVLFLWSKIKEGYVAIVPGKQLSTEDFTTAEKQKLAGIPEGGISGGGTADAVAWANITGKPEVFPPDMTDLMSKTEIQGIHASMQTAINSKASEEQLQTLTDSVNTELAKMPTTEQMNTAINEKVIGVYRWAGSVPSYANLPTSGMSGGDVYNVEDTDMNYAWVVNTRTREGGYWDPLGTTFKIEPIPNSVIQQIVEGTYGS